MESKKNRNSSATQKPPPQLVFRMNENGTGSDTVREVLLDRGWEEFVEGQQNEFDWNLWWRYARYRQCDYDDLMPWQRLNHFPKTTAITKKDMLARNMKRMKGVYGASVFNFTPLAFNLPNDYTKFVAEYTKLREQNQKDETNKREFWICKPADSSRGRGIFLFEDLSELTYDCSAVAQKYITNPCLIAGYKFDLRLYVLVTSFHPLTVYMYQEGIVRFSTEKFDLNSIGNLFSHLTNTSINKFSPSYTTDKERVGQGCKWTLTMLRNYFHQQDVDDEVLWQKISNVVTLTLLAQVTSVPKVTGAFELFGFDIIIDANLKPWLLEVNFNPALNEDCPVDAVVKRSLINNVIDILGFEDVDGFRGGEQYAKLKSKQYNTRQRQSRFVPRAAPKPNLRKAIKIRARPGKQAKKMEGNGELSNKSNNSSDSESKTLALVKSSSKTTMDSEDDYDEEIALACGVPDDAKSSTPARSTTNSKLQFKSPSLSKLSARDSSLETQGKSSSIDNIWIPSIEESRKALASRRELIRKREEHMNVISSLSNQVSPLARISSDLNKSKSSLAGSNSDVSNLDGMKSNRDSSEIPTPVRNGTLPIKATGQQSGTGSRSTKNRSLPSSPSQVRKARGDQQKADVRNGVAAGTKSRTKYIRSSLYSKPAVGQSRLDPRGASQSRSRAYVWPPARSGDFVLVFPFNEVTKRASYPNMEMRTVIKETQKQLKRMICKSKTAKKLSANSPSTLRKVSPQRTLNQDVANCDGVNVMWAPLRSATVTAVEA
ncbi:uncharacterized protein [Apostichopus japonicus]|uniref:uncharacterized protein n=1 Tax=Stichopus japonicus TaxID=307972 RepID=UPI003AB73E40